MKKFKGAPSLPWKSFPAGIFTHIILLSPKPLTLLWLLEHSREGAQFIRKNFIWQKLVAQEFPRQYQCVWDSGMKENIRERLDDCSVNPKREETYWKRYYELLNSELKDWEKVDSLFNEWDIVSLGITSVFYHYENNDRLYGKYSQNPNIIMIIDLKPLVNLKLVQIEDVKILEDEFQILKPKSYWVSENGLYRYTFSSNNVLTSLKYANKLFS